MRILILFIIIYLIGIILFFGCSRFNLYQIKNSKPGPNVLLIGGTHGDEPASLSSLLIFKNLLKNNKIKLNYGKLSIIYNVNNCGYYFNNRHYSVIGKKIDLNRKYDTGFPINKNIEKIVKNNDLIIDFHEGWGYLSGNKGSIGSSITINNYSIKVIKNLIKKLNRNISNRNKKWKLNTDYKLIKNSLRDFCKNKHYILVETSGKNNIQPLHVRVNQNLQIISHILNKQISI